MLVAEVWWRLGFMVVEGYGSGRSMVAARVYGSDLRAWQVVWRRRNKGETELETLRKTRH